jgi:hypothetical protein
MRLLAAVCAVSVIAGPAYGQGLVLPVAPDVAPASPPNTIQMLEDCVLAQAKRLEISQEAADIVAIAAINSCSRELTAASTPAAGGRVNAETRQQLKDAMRDAAITQIVETRTLAHTPPPPPPPPEAKPKPPVRRAVRPAAKPAASAAPAKPATTVPR